MQKVNVFWFRRDLRLEDNVGLFYALSEEIPVLPIFIFDTNILDRLEDKTDARVTFIYDQLSSINRSLQRRGFSLHVFHGAPVEVYNQILKDFQVGAVYTNRDYEPYAISRDQEIEALLKKHDSAFYAFKDHVIFEKGEILNDQGAPYKVFTLYKRRWLEKFEKQSFAPYNSKNLESNFFSCEPLDMLTLDSLGFQRSNIEIPSCELNEPTIRKYGQDRDYPFKDGTSRLGVHLRFGTLSIRKAVAFAHKHSEVWLSELIWREFYSMILAHFPRIVNESFKPQYDRIEWINDQKKFEAWCNGKTGYPVVDAGMRELNATGYMHNRVRMITASFLTKHLLIDWRWGEAYFASKLLDFDLASNNGGWQWAAGTGTDAQPYFRVFNPYSQQEKFDPQWKYIKKWVPELDTPEYPKPIVEHKSARERAIKTYKESVS